MGARKIERDGKRAKKRGTQNGSNKFVVERASTIRVSNFDQKNVNSELEIFFNDYGQLNSTYPISKVDFILTPMESRLYTL